MDGWCYFCWHHLLINTVFIEKYSCVINSFRKNVAVFGVGHFKQIVLLNHELRKVPGDDRTFETEN